MPADTFLDIVPTPCVGMLRGRSASCDLTQNAERLESVPAQSMETKRRNDN